LDFSRLRKILRLLLLLWRWLLLLWCWLLLLRLLLRLLLIVLLLLLLVLLLLLSVLLLLLLWRKRILQALRGCGCVQAHGCRTLQARLQCQAICPHICHHIRCRDNQQHQQPSHSSISSCSLHSIYLWEKTKKNLEKKKQRDID
jgi:hypothetical protein